MNEKGLKIIVSDCLMGTPCRWHGKDLRMSSYVKKYIAANPDVELIPVCPEMLGGLPVPRPPVKRKKGRVYETCEEKTNRKNVTGKDITDSFQLGAQKTLDLAKKNNVKTAIMCNWSPSCDKSGITGKLLIANGIEVINTW